MTVEREMFRGDTRVIDYEIKDSEDRAYDLTGAKLWFTVKNNYVDPDNQAIVQYTTDTAAITITDAVRGKVRVTIAPIATRALPDGVMRMVYDLQLKDAAGIVSTVEAGVLIVKPDVTRAIT